MFYNNEDNDVTITFGVYDIKSDKIFPLDEISRVKAQKIGFPIGDYNKYDLRDKKGVTE